MNGLRIEMSKDNRDYEDASFSESESNFKKNRYSNDNHNYDSIPIVISVDSHYENDEHSQNSIPTIIPINEESPSSTKSSTKGKKLGILESIFWALCFFILNIIGMLIGVICSFFIQYSHFNGDSAQFREIILDQLEDIRDNNHLGVYVAELFNAGFIGAEGLTVLFILVVTRLRMGRYWYREVHLSPPKIGHFLLAMLCLPVLMIVHGFAHELGRAIFQPIVNDPNQQIDLMSLIIGKMNLGLAIMVIGICPGFGEELLCRGLIGSGLRNRYNFMVSLLVSSLLFGLLHFEPSYVFGTAFMGVFLFVIFYTTRSLFLTMILHALNNSLTVLQNKGIQIFGNRDLDNLGLSLSDKGLIIILLMTILMIFWYTRIPWYQKITPESKMEC